MKLSEQIANTCCGVLADKEEMIRQARELELAIEIHEKRIEELKAHMMEIGSETED